MQLDNAHIVFQETAYWGLTINNWLTIVSLLFAALAFALAFIQYRKNIKINRAEKAIRMAELFAEDILPRITSIGDIYNKIGIAETIQEACSSIGKCVLDFSETEYGMIDNSQLQKIAIYDLALSYEILDDLPREIVVRVEGIRKKNNIDESFILNFRNMRGETLNKLEAFSMCFITKVANEGVIFQSIHQAFCSFMLENHLYISAMNAKRTPSTKFYVYSKKLYNIWVKKEIKLDRQHANKMQRLAFWESVISSFISKRKAVADKKTYTEKA